MKWIKSILILTIVGLSLLFVTGHGHLLRALWATYLQGETTGHINDLDFFDSRLVEAADEVQQFENHPKKNSFQLTETLIQQHKDLKSVGFVVLKDGKILHESYWNGYTKDTLTNTFSMTKTIVTLLLGFAIEDGYVKSLDQPITDFIPEFKDDSLAKNVSIGDFSSMTSSYDWTEEYYLPFFNPTAKAYYAKNIEDDIVNGEFSAIRGRKFMYSSGDTQLLAIALRRATKKDLTTYLSEKLWKPLGMANDAKWVVDNKEKGIERAFCCLFTDTQSWAKIGQLILQKGSWNNQQILDSSFVERMSKPVNDPVYGFSLWLDWEYDTPFYMLSGLRGQRTIIIPSENLVIVRLGEDEDVSIFEKNGVKRYLEKDIYILVDEVMKSIKSL